MSDLLHVGFAADIVQNVFGYLVVIHVFSLYQCETNGPRAEKSIMLPYTTKKTQ